MPNKHIKERLFEIIDECKTQREAARRLDACEQYIYLLCRQNGITKWRQKKRIHKDIPKKTKICEECGEVFTKAALNNNPNRFCSKKCQGRWLGKNHGFKKLP